MNAPGGRGFAYAGAALGGAVSIAANVAHSYVPPHGAAASWRPEGGAVAGAVFWPVALFVAVEIFARVAWPAGRRWVALRYAGLLPVAAVAALVSYRHLSGLLAHYREDAVTVAVGPLAVDGLMVMAAAALIATARAVPAVLAENSHEKSHENSQGAAEVHAPVGSADDLPGLRIPAENSQPAAPPDLPGPAPEVRDDGADLGEVERTALEVAADLRRTGQPVSRAAMLRELRARGVTVSTDRGGELARWVKTVPAAPDPVLNGSAAPPGAR